MADDPAGLVSAYYEILQAGAESYDPERLRSILLCPISTSTGGELPYLQHNTLLDGEGSRARSWGSTLGTVAGNAHATRA